jgi:hypothetical protein
MDPIEIPDDWDDRGLITFEEFCELIRTPQRTVHDWRQRGIGPRWAGFNGRDRLLMSVAKARQLLSSATPTRNEERADG